MANPRILHISASKTWRGGEQQLAYLAEELAEKNISQWVFCVKSSAMETFCIQQKIPFYTFKKIVPTNPLVAWKILKICRSEKISILHAHDSHALTFGVLAASFSKVFPISNKISFKIIISRRVDFPINSKWKYNHSSIKKILCVSNFVKEIIEKDISKKELLEVVYDGVDLKRFQYPNQNILRKEFKISPEIPIIANIAAIAPHKDYFTFVRTVEILIHRNVQAKFLIIGADGGEASKIRAFIKTKNLENHIILTGFRNDIPQIFPEIDLLLFTSKTEGLGTTLLDAFICKVPVVATAGGGIPEIVNHNITGFLAEVGNADQLADHVIQLLQNNSLREVIIKESSEKVKEFSKERMAQKTLENYYDI